MVLTLEPQYIHSFVIIRHLYKGTAVTQYITVATYVRSYVRSKLL